MVTNRMGQQFGNYRVGKLLGWGGFAEVYLGEHIYMESQVALKILNTQLTGSDWQSFRQEARLLATLEHPNIIHVRDFDLQNGVPFLVMDYAQNGALRDHYARGTRLPPDVIISYTLQVARALQYAHDHKILHRDVKPENMLLGRNNEVLLSDFGIAVMTVTSSMHQTRTPAGTASYMSPEQIAGQVQPASDQYSLAVVVYEWICGEPPFHGSSREVMAKHLYAHLPSFSEKGVTVTPEIEAVITRALAKKAEDRYASVQEFALILQQSASQPTKSQSTNKQATGDGSLYFSPQNQSTRFTANPVPPSPHVTRPTHSNPSPPPVVKIQPTIPAPQPQVFYPHPNNAPYWQGPYPPTQAAERARRGTGCLWATIISVILLMGLIGGGIIFGSQLVENLVSPFTHFSSSGVPPGSDAVTTVNQFCIDLNSGNKQGAYDLTSPDYQHQHSIGDFSNQFATMDLLKGGCLHDNGTTSGSKVLVKLTINGQDNNLQPTTTSYTATLTQSNGTWLIDNIQ